MTTSIHQRLEQRKRFVHQLAVFLVESQARKLMQLERGIYSAKEWAALRDTIPTVFGWGTLTVEEAEQQIEEFLFG